MSKRADGNMSTAVSKAKSVSEASSMRLLEREEEYKRLNAELEAQTAMLVKEAEVMMKEQDTFLKQVSPSSASSVRRSVVKSPKLNEESDIVNVVSRDTGLLSIAAGAFEDGFSDDEDYNGAIPSQRSSARSNSAKLQRPSSKAKKLSARNKKSAKPASRGLETYKAGEMPLPFSGLEAGALDSAIEAAYEGGAMADDDVMPEVATEMGSEAQIRFLKAKLRVLQEELTEQTKQALSASEESNKYKLELKEAREETERIKKNFNQQQMQVQKLKSCFEDERKKTEAKVTQLQNVSKELESLKREQKQSATLNNATEVRLNRASEELEKVKSQLQKQKSSGKELSTRDQREIDNLRSENKRLDRLRNDSLTIMKKQQKLIGILKRQILHIEAAKLLSFTEDEFVKTLDWGNK